MCCHVVLGLVEAGAMPVHMAGRPLQRFSCPALPGGLSTKWLLRAWVYRGADTILSADTTPGLQWDMLYGPILIVHALPKFF